MIQGRPLYTPAALGSALLLGAQSGAEVRLTAGVVFAYTVFHVVAFILVGVALAWSARQLERLPAFWLVTLFAVIVLDALFVGVVGSLAIWVLGTIGVWAVAVANLIAVAAMGWRIWATRPEFRAQFSHAPAETHA
jgi:hypothetical protein